MLKLFYLRGENASKAVLIYYRNYELNQSPYSVKDVRNFVKKFKETICTCERPRSGRPRVPIEFVSEVNNVITPGPLHTARSVSRKLDIPKNHRSPNPALRSADVSLYNPERSDIGTWRQQTICRAFVFFLQHI